MIDLAGAKIEDMVLVPSVGQYIAMYIGRGFGGGFPSSLMGVIAYVRQIYNNSGKGTIPTPITMDELEQMLLDFGIMKTEEQQLAELAAKEAKLAVALAG